MRVVGLVQDITVKITIPVIIKKGRLRSEACKIKPVLLTLFCKSIIAIINEEFIVPNKTIFIIDRTDINIKQPVPVYISHCDSRTAVGFTCNRRRLRDIFENKIAFIEI